MLAALGSGQSVSCGSSPPAQGPHHVRCCTRRSGIAGAAIATAAHRIMGCVRGAELLAVPAARPAGLHQAPHRASALGAPIAALAHCLRQKPSKRARERATAAPHRIILGRARGAELLAVPAARPPSGTSALGAPCGSGALSAPGAIKARARARQGALSDQGLWAGAARPSSSHGIFFLEVPAVPRSGHSVRGLPTFPT